MSKILHNPKSHSPAVYIPCWLIQVPVKKLSYGAKFVYGRLSQWCNETGKAYRSAPQLAEELGMCVSSVEKFQKELRDVQLIGTFQPQAGGVNHFEFYDHPWMHEPINENLVYKKDKPHPPYDLTAPPVKVYGTPPYDLTDINNKEIKEIKCVGETPLTHSENSSNQKTNQKTNPKEKTESTAFSDPEIKEFFDTKFCGTQCTYTELFEDCKKHYESKGQWVNAKKWKAWIKRETLDQYAKTQNSPKKAPDNETEQQRMNRQYAEYEHSKEKDDLSYKSKFLENERRLQQTKEGYKSQYL